MTAPSQTPEAAGLEDAGHIVWWKAGGVSYYPKGDDFTVSASCRVEPLVTAASAQAAIDAVQACAQEEADRLASKATEAQIVAASWKDRATAAEARNAELSMLAYKWMEAHDRLQSGLHYDLPNPADVPAEKARADRLAKALKETRNRVREWPIDDHETCMCGSPVASHGMGDGHSPVSQGDHAISMIVEAINEALQQETQP